jgi:alpha-L-fucosidase
VGAKLLLNVPPNCAGRISKVDSMRLVIFNQYLKQAFDDNLFDEHANATSSIDRGYGYKAQNVLDGNYNTYWATPDSIDTGSIEIKMQKKKLINCIKLQEYIPLGQRVDDFSIETYENGRWVKVFDGSTIGYQHIVRFDPIRTNKIRISIKQSFACPVINNIEGYYIEPFKQFKREFTVNDLQPLGRALNSMRVYSRTVS